MSDSTILKPTPTQRKRYSLAFKQQVVQQTMEPRASLARIAREHGLNANMLSNWRRRLGHATNSTMPAPVLLPIQIQAPLPAAGDSMPSANCLEIDFPSARLTIHGCPNQDALRLVLQVLIS